VELPAVLCVPPPLGAPVNGCDPAGRMARHPWATGVPGLPGNHPERGAVPGTKLLHSGPSGTGPGQHGPTSTDALATGRAPPGGPGPGAPIGNPDPHAAQGPHRGLVHVRPGTHLPATGPGAGENMGDPGTPSIIPPHCPRCPRTGRQGDEILIDPAMPTQLPGGSYGPIGRPDQLHTPAGGQQTAPGRGPEAGPRPWRRLLLRPKPRTGQELPSGPSWRKGRQDGPSNS